MKIFLILWLEVRELRCLFQCVNWKQRFQLDFTQDFRSKFRNTQRLATYWQQRKQLNSMEILIYFIVNTVECDRSTWLARRKVDRSSLLNETVGKLSEPCIKANLYFFECRTWGVRLRVKSFHNMLTSYLRLEDVRSENTYSR